MKIFDWYIFSINIFIVGEYEAEFSALLDKVEDRTGLQAIRLLHQQLDDDKDGTIEPFETGDFIKADLKVTKIYV